MGVRWEAACLDTSFWPLFLSLRALAAGIDPKEQSVNLGKYIQSQYMVPESAKSLLLLSLATLIGILFLEFCLFWNVL